MRWPDTALDWEKPHNQSGATATALQNAASIAGLMLTTEAMIADFPEEKGEGGGMPGGMGGMDDY